MLGSCGRGKCLTTDALQDLKGYFYNYMIFVRTRTRITGGKDTIRLKYKQENQVGTMRELTLEDIALEDITLEDIAPLWASRLGDERKCPTFMSPTWFKWCRELRCTSRCVVGEAYG